MALSGTESYSSTAGDIITDALQLLGVVAPWQSPNTESMDKGMRFLNLMIKSWTMDNVNIWTQQEGVVLLNYNEDKYTFPDSSLTGGDDGILNEDELNATSLSDDFVTTDTTITVESNTGIGAGDNIFIVLDDGTRFETTVANVSGNDTVVLTLALTGDASEANAVFTYATSATVFNPREIYNVRLRNSEGTERRLTELSRSDYYSLAQKTMTGSPTQYYVDTQLDHKVLILYPVPIDISESIRYTYTRALDDVTQLTQTVNFPQEWQLALVFNLAVLLSHQFGRKEAIGSVNDPKSIAAIADSEFIKAAAYSDPNTAIQFNPSWRPY